MAALVGLVLLALARAWARADIVMLCGLTAMIAAGEVMEGSLLPGASEALAGFGNPAIVAVGSLFVVVAGLSSTGALDVVAGPLLGRVSSERQALTRLLPTVAGLSAFMNNTPVVAMFMPVVSDLSRRSAVSASRLLLPLSYLSILGGTCTLIGTSTNLVIDGMLVSAGHPGLGMFEITWLGLPLTLLGLVYVLVAAPRVLPARRSVIGVDDDVRQYTVELEVEPEGPLVDQTIEQAGLRHLPGLFLVEIERRGDVLPAVGPDARLLGGDRLVFAGVLESVVDLQRTRGLRAAGGQVSKIPAAAASRCLVEAVVSDRCPLVGRSIRDGRFRTHYGAAVLAVARSGQRLTGKIGDIVLTPGDTLLLEAPQSFAVRQRNARDFFLVSAVDDSVPRRRDRAFIALSVLIGMVALVTSGTLSMTAASMLAAGFMILGRCATGPEARRSVDWTVLLVIGAALGLGKGFASTGAAQAFADRVISLAGSEPMLVLVAVYVATNIITELVTNNAAAVLMFPIALAAAEGLQVSAMPFVMVVMVAASASFATPLGYQTNLMVQGPGGYRFSDYLRFGLPLNALAASVSVILAPLIWPFAG